MTAPSTTDTSFVTTPFAGLWASQPATLPFARSETIRAFLLERQAGNLLVYSAPSATTPTTGGVSWQYLNHWHEVAFELGGKMPGARLLVHEADREETERYVEVHAAFSGRHRLAPDFEIIPIPGHTPGATAFLWDNGEQRFLFTGDSLFLRDESWTVAVLEGSSDRAAYIESLELIRNLEFDVLVPWVARGDAYYTVTDAEDARIRLDVILDRVRRGENR